MWGQGVVVTISAFKSAIPILDIGNYYFLRLLREFISFFFFKVNQQYLIANSTLDFASSGTETMKT